MDSFSFNQSLVVFEKIRQFEMMDLAVIQVIHEFSQMKPDVHSLENMIVEGNAEMFDFLLEHVSFNKPELTSALNAAVKMDNLSAVEKLMEKLENVEDDDSDEPDYIWTAVENDSIKCFIYLIEYNDPPESYLHLMATVAAQHDSHIILRYILAETWVNCDLLLGIAERNGSHGIIDFLNDEHVW